MRQTAALRLLAILPPAIALGAAVYCSSGDTTRGGLESEPGAAAPAPATTPSGPGGYVETTLTTGSVTLVADGQAAAIHGSQVM